MGQGKEERRAGGQVRAVDLGAEALVLGEMGEQGVFEAHEEDLGGEGVGELEGAEGTSQHELNELPHGDWYWCILGVSRLARDVCGRSLLR